MESPQYRNLEAIISAILVRLPRKGSGLEVSAGVKLARLTHSDAQDQPAVHKNGRPHKNCPETTKFQTDPDW